MKGYSVSVLTLATAAVLASAYVSATELESPVSFPPLGTLPNIQCQGDAAECAKSGGDKVREANDHPNTSPSAQCQGDTAECAQSSGSKVRVADTIFGLNPNVQCQGDDAECAQAGSNNKVRVANSAPPLADIAKSSHGFGSSLAAIIDRIIGQRPSSSSSLAESDTVDEDPQYNIIVQNTPIIEMIYNYMSPIDSAVESSAETVATAEDINDNVSDSEYVSSRILVPARTVTVTVTVAATPEEFSESLEANFGSLGSVDEGSAIGIVESADIESSSLAAIESSAPADVESTAEPSGFASFVEPAESLVDEGSTIVPGLRNIGKAGVVAAQPEDNDDSIDDFDYASWSSRIDAAAHKLASNVGGMIVEMITQVPASAAATQTADAENIEPTHVF